MVLICDGKYMKKSHLLQAVALDRAVYPQSYWLDDETALGYLYARPEVYTYAVDGDELVAYLNMSCIDERSYLTLLEGYQNDLCIDAGNLTEPMPNCNNYLYFSSIAVAPAYRGIGIARKLFARFGEKLSLLRKRGVYFTDVIADAVSPHGEKACLIWKTCISTTCLFRMLLKMPILQGMWWTKLKSAAAVALLPRAT